MLFIGCGRLTKDELRRRNRGVNRRPWGAEYDAAACIHAKMGLVDGEPTAEAIARSKALVSAYTREDVLRYILFVRNGPGHQATRTQVEKLDRQYKKRHM